MNTCNMIEQMRAIARAYLHQALKTHRESQRVLSVTVELWNNFQMVFFKDSRKRGAERLVAQSSLEPTM
jgi:hypothetical protein